MNRDNSVLDRLLHASAIVRQNAGTDLPPAPRAAFLLAQRECHREAGILEALVLLRQGLAAVGVLLVVVGALSFQAVRSAGQDRLLVSDTMLVLARGATLP